VEEDTEISNPEGYYHRGINQAFIGLGISLYIPVVISLIISILALRGGTSIDGLIVLSILAFIFSIIGSILFLSGMRKMYAAQPYLKINGPYQGVMINDYDDSLSANEKCRMCQGLKECAICDATGICHVCRGKVLTDKKTGHTKTCPLCGGTRVCYHCKGEKKCPQYH
jgi:hypothetical protein